MNHPQLSTVFIESVKNHKFIVWDWNGTILNDREVGYLAEKKQFENYGLKALDPEVRRKIYEYPLENYYRKAGFPVAKVGFSKIADEFVNIYSGLCEQAEIFPGLEDLFKRLNDDGVQQFVLSAAPETLLLQNA